MSEEEILKRLRDSMVSLDIESIRAICNEVLVANIPASKAIEAMAEGMEIVGEKYQNKEYFLVELMVAAENMKQATAIFGPRIAGENAQRGKMVLGTVQYDVHDIGKNIVASFLRAAGFEVVDLGVDVPATKFVEAVNASKPDILGMSGLLVVSMPEMGKVIRMLKEAGIRDDANVIIGGSPITPSYGQQIGADYATKDAFEGIDVCKKWIEQKGIR